MNYPVETPPQVRGVLRALRRSRGMTQTELGVLMGVSQKRIAAIEAAPHRTSFDQIAKYVAVLGAKLVVEDKPRSAPADNVEEDEDTW